MRGALPLACFLLGCSALAQNQGNQGYLASQFGREGREFSDSCTSFKSLASCGQLLVTGTPLRITAGSIAPQNGMAFGPAFVFDKDYTSWRMNFNADAVASINQSWRAGVYVKLTKTPSKAPAPVVLTQRPTHPLESGPPAPAPEINLYAQAISLNHLNYYGIGNSSSRNDLALFGMREVIEGVNLVLPFGNSGLALFGEFNGRSVSIRGASSSTAASLFSLPASSLPPGAIDQPGFLQAGEGLRFNHDFGSAFDLDYSAVYQQFIAPSNNTYSFRRLNLDFSHTIWLYGRRLSGGGTHSYGPDGSQEALNNHHYVRDRNGSINLAVLLTQLYVPGGHLVPFYFQPTLGGGDINGDKLLPSYPDYRFRGPNLLLFHGGVEHSVWGPIGLQFLADFGKVGATPGEIGFDHFRHSYGAGLTIRAGDFPAVSLLFAWGGGEGTHTIAEVSPSLLGSSGRPSLF